MGTTRKLLVLAFLLYDIVATATRQNNYDYDDTEALKRFSLRDSTDDRDRRHWRNKAQPKPMDDHRDWEKKRYEYENPRYAENMDTKSFNGLDRVRETDSSTAYRHRRYEDMVDKMMPPAAGMKSAEIGQSAIYLDKDAEKKIPLELNCQRPHEKYESCFAGCASVTCDNPRDRMQPCYPFCEAGCVCAHPYVRDDRTHKCVLPEDCTKGLKGIPDLGDETAIR